MAMGTHGITSEHHKALYFTGNGETEWTNRVLVEFPSVEMVKTQLDMVLDKLTLPGQGE